MTGKNKKYEGTFFGKIGSRIKNALNMRTLPKEYDELIDRIISKQDFVEGLEKFRTSSLLSKSGDKAMSEIIEVLTECADSELKGSSFVGKSLDEAKVKELNPENFNVKDFEFAILSYAKKELNNKDIVIGSSDFVKYTICSHITGIKINKNSEVTKNAKEIKANVEFWQDSGLKPKAGDTSLQYIYFLYKKGIIFKEAFIKIISNYIFETEKISSLRTAFSIAKKTKCLYQISKIYEKREADKLLALVNHAYSKSNDRQACIDGLIEVGKWLCDNKDEENLSDTMSKVKKEKLFLFVTDDKKKKIVRPFKKLVEKVDITNDNHFSKKVFQVSSVLESVFFMSKVGDADDSFEGTQKLSVFNEKDKRFSEPQEENDQPEPKKLHVKEEPVESRQVSNVLESSEGQSGVPESSQVSENDKPQPSLEGNIKENEPEVRKNYKTADKIRLNRARLSDIIKFCGKYENNAIVASFQNAQNCELYADIFYHLLHEFSDYKEGVKKAITFFLSIASKESKIDLDLFMKFMDGCLHQSENLKIIKQQIKNRHIEDILAGNETENKITKFKALAKFNMHQMDLHKTLREKGFDKNELGQFHDKTTYFTGIYKEIYEDLRDISNGKFNADDDLKMFGHSNISEISIDEQSDIKGNIKEPIGQRQPNEDIGSQKDKTGEEITNDKSKNKDDVKQRIKGYLEKIRRTEEKNRIFKYFARAFRKVIQKDSKSAGLKV